MIKALRIYMLTCPLLKDGALHVNHLGAEPIQYTLDQVPADRIIKRYTDGGSLRQLTFVFASMEEYGPDVLVNLEKSGFYQDLAEWFEKESDNGTLPELPEGKVAQEIEVLTQDYLFSAEEDRARYQIQCRLIYYQN